MNVIKILVATFLIFVATTEYVAAQSATWTDGGGDASWSNSANWSGGVPVSGTNVIFADPISVVGVDTGGATTVASISVNATTAAFSIVPSFSESLIVNGSFLNNSSNLVTVNLTYTVGSTSTLDGPIAFMSTLNIDLRTVTVVGSISMNANIVMQLNNSTGTGYGRFSVGGASTLTFGGGLNSIKFSPASTYSGVNGDIFNLVTNSGGTLLGFSSSLFDVSTLPTLTGALTWNTSALSTGTLSVVPEPKTWLMLALGLTVIVVFRRRQKA